MNVLKNTSAWLLILTTLVSCSSTTIIRSSDSAARIYVDGEFRGKGSAVWSDQKIVGSSTDVKIQKAGCEPVYYNFSRNEQFDAGACAGGVFVIFPFIWIMRYKPEHYFEYSCKPE
jgi:hypothetical protein